MVGLDREAAKRAFDGFLTGKTLTATQIQFVNLVIDYLTQAGWMSPSQLYESPFTDFSSRGVEGVFDSTQVTHLLGFGVDSLDVKAGSMSLRRCCWGGLERSEGRRLNPRAGPGAPGRAAQERVRSHPINQRTVRSALLLCPLPLRPAQFLCSRNLTSCGGRHCAFTRDDRHNLRSPDLHPSSALSGGDTGATCGGDSFFAGFVRACPVKRRDGTVNAFKLRRETGVFLLELVEYRGQGRHGRGLYSVGERT
jgi:hypothetical protein